MAKVDKNRGKIRKERWIRNIQQSHDPNSTYDGNLFGVTRCSRSPVVERKKVINKPSELLFGFLFCNYAAELLDPFYNVEELRTIHLLASRAGTLNKKHFPDCQTVFTPRLALFLMFMSEDDIFERYLRAWRKYKPHKDLKIPDSLITPDLIPGCDCIGCFGRCVTLADKYKLLPDNTNNRYIEYQRQRLR